MGHQGLCLFRGFSELLLFRCVPVNVSYPFQEAKEQLSPLSVALEKLQQEKQELLDRKRQRQEEGQEKVRDALNANS